jgi:hypothetical protein
LYALGPGNTPGLIGGAVVLLLGVEALVAAAQGRDPLQSKLGPLP